MADAVPRLTQFGSAFAWLLSKGVSSFRLATLFQTTPENVRVIAFRSRHRTAPEDPVEERLRLRPTYELAERLGVRPPPDDVVRTRAGTRKLEWLRNEIDETVRRHSARYEFLDGARALRQLLPRIGYAGDSRRIALRALLHQKAAWFFVHCGRCASASYEADVARGLWRLAYHESGEREYASH